VDEAQTVLSNNRDPGKLIFRVGKVLVGVCTILQTFGYEVVSGKVFFYLSKFVVLWCILGHLVVTVIIGNYNTDRRAV
jgi:hypothetical protein